MRNRAELLDVIQERLAAQWIAYNGQLEGHDERTFRQEVDNLSRELVGCQAIRCSHRSGSPISSSVGRASGLSHAWSSVVHEARASTPLMN